MKITKLRDQLTIIGEDFDESELVHFIRMLSKVGAPMVFSLYYFWFSYLNTNKKHSSIARIWVF
jgi:hypothetical protein